MFIKLATLKTCVNLRHGVSPSNSLATKKKNNNNKIFLHLYIFYSFPTSYAFVKSILNSKQRYKLIKSNLQMSSEWQIFWNFAGCRSWMVRLTEKYEGIKHVKIMCYIQNRHKKIGVVWENYVGCHIRILLFTACSS